jgi:hypothetical protein
MSSSSYVDSNMVSTQYSLLVNFLLHPCYMTCSTLKSPYYAFIDNLTAMDSCDHPL